MFNVLVSGNENAWETDQIMRIGADRFKESSGSESALVDPAKPDTLKALEGIHTLLLYEVSDRNPNAQIVRVGLIRQIAVVSGEISFRFAEIGKLTRANVEEFADRLGINRLEFGRTHWAIKDGGVPKGLLERLTAASRSYDVVLSFAGEQRDYVEEVADLLVAHNVHVFYDGFNEAELWGKDLVEYFDLIYRKSGRFCLMFVSSQYADKMWTRHERRSALARAIEVRSEYILPVRFDKTELEGLRPTISYVDGRRKSPDELASLLLQKLSSSVVPRGSDPVKEVRNLNASSVLIRLGNIFQNSTDMVVLPCSAKGTITDYCAAHVSKYGIPMPPVMPLGSISIIDFPGSGNLTKYVAWAASVLNDVSSVDVIEGIGAHLGRQTQRNNLVRLIEAPLLGTGHGRLPNGFAAEALARGFLSTASAGAVLMLYSMNANTCNEVRERLERIAHPKL